MGARRFREPENSLRHFLLKGEKARMRGSIKLILIESFSSPYDANSQVVARNTPPSTLIAAPFVALANGEHKYVTRFATSSTEAKRFNKDVGRTLRKNSCSNSSGVCLVFDASCPTNSVTPSDAVDPGNTPFTVTPVPLVSWAMPLTSASSAAFVIP